MAQNQIVEFQQDLASRKQAVASRLPSHIDPDRFIRIAVTAAAKNPKILDCSRDSILMSIYQACELGLEPGGALGEGYLVPYGNTCQFIPGYRGLISLARRSGQIISIEAHAVYEVDEFVVEFGLEPKLIHKPTLKTERGEVTAFYAIARIVGGGIQHDYMTKADVDAIRKRSRAASSGPWVTDYNEMGKKTVIRRLFKSLPVSVELCRALELQAGAEKGEFEPSLEVLQERAQVTTDLNAAAAESASARVVVGKA
jgi:recombination protein RecT